MAATSERPADVRVNGYTDILFARGMHCMRELKIAAKDKAKSKYAMLAIGYFFDYLSELYANGLEDWHINDAFKLIHVAMSLGNLSERDLDSIEASNLVNKQGQNTTKAM